MKQYVGIWIDTKHAVVIHLSNGTHSIKKIDSNIDTRETAPVEAKKFGRFGKQYLTYKRNRKNKKRIQTHKFFHSLLKEMSNCDGIVIFGPSKMKFKFERELKLNMLFGNKIDGVYNSELISDNDKVDWVKDFYK